EGTKGTYKIRERKSGQGTGVEFLDLQWGKDMKAFELLVFGKSLLVVKYDITPDRFRAIQYRAMKKSDVESNSRTAVYTLGNRKLEIAADGTTQIISNDPKE
ncbi:MAG: hypothetical protein AAF492_29900, partial [Verrucomicrobiota bacterium]